MKNLLVGNGINIQFNKTDYTTQQIVLRLLKNCDRDDFPSHIIVNFPYLIKNYIGQLYLESRKILSGEYDNFTFGSAEKDSLIAFKKQYSNKINTFRITDIGFEDYYLIHDLVCHKMKVHNPEQFYIRESMKIAYLYSIFNDGKLNQLYVNYPTAFIEFLLDFDNIFTTNYDSNIELATGKEIFHIHGQFDKKSDVYNASSFRNQLPDAPIREIEVDENYFYLYSNALTTHCGAYKEFQLKQHSQANSCVEKMALAYNTDSKMKQEVDNYHFAKFKSIMGTLKILGLSPWNDFHIFESIDAADLEKCVYYFFNENECDIIKNLLPTLYEQRKLKFESVKAFWEDCREK